MQLNRINRARGMACGLALLAAAVSFKLNANSSALIRRKPAEDGRVRAERIDRLRSNGVDQAKVAEFVARFRRHSREQLIGEGYLSTVAPSQGSVLISARQRTAAGNELLEESKDLLFALLFGDATTGVQLERTERELLTLVVPRAKAAVLAFMQASTELAGYGTWQDPTDAASDQRADNVIIEVEYGEVGSELVGDGILTALRLINLLEVNEQVLYARMTNIEQSSLVN